MQDHNHILHQTASWQVFTTRIIKYPVAKVYHTFSNPQQLAVWRRPNGFANTFYDQIRS